LKITLFKISPKYIFLALWLSLAISVLVHFTSLLDEFVLVQNNHASVVSFCINVFIELFITFFIAFVLFYLNYFILKPHDINKKSGTIRLLISVAVSLLIVNVLSDFLFQIKHLLLLQVLNHGSQKIYFFRDVFITLVVIICVSIIKVVFQNQQHRMEIQQLKIENLSRQFEVLKGQLSPHFLFNSLTALKTLITDSPAVAEQYLAHLSSVLRYTLQSGENKLVSLSTEIKFVESYFFLVKLRYNQNISLRTEVNEQQLHLYLPPLALQILIENAIRHNEISRKNPLEVSIVAKSNRVIVSNNINQKISPEPGTGIGLVNLSNQYKLLAGKEIVITKESNHFNVELPLFES